MHNRYQAGATERKQALLPRASSTRSLQFASLFASVSLFGRTSDPYRAFVFGSDTTIHRCVCVCAALHDTANSICCTRSAEYGLLKLEESASQSACATCRRQRTTTLNNKKKKKKGPFIPPRPGDAAPGSCISLEIGRKQKWQTESEERKKKANDFAGVARSNTRQRKDVSDTHTIQSVRVHSSRARAKGGEVGGFRAHSVACQASPGKRQRLSAMLNDSSIANSHASCL